MGFSLGQNPAKSQAPQLSNLGISLKDALTRFCSPMFLKALQEVGVVGSPWVSWGTQYRKSWDSGRDVNSALYELS